MQSFPIAQVDKVEQPPELKELVLGLRDDKLREYAVRVPIQHSSATFNVDRQTELLTYVKQLYNKPFAHAFGAVLQRGVTVFSGPFSYTLIPVDLIDIPQVSIDGSALEEHSLLYVHSGPLPVKVTSGRVVLIVFAWQKKE
ncbi:uncharacterized protein EKO05_0005365 [Ascochyta rabiei]|uniref:uncharacterized protein n=1 Tax=Didymella rabiei TaxID=5454 RepID=UPI0021FEEC25|nr:uncharacterized protein EKO05_0005365 [Ascochyta rabiei]UPX14894.1 hypothetical protein EKO05_0005365 [Ascochyta rabiei]